MTVLRTTVHGPVHTRVHRIVHSHSAPPCALSGGPLPRGMHSEAREDRNYRQKQVFLGCALWGELYSYFGPHSAHPVMRESEGPVGIALCSALCQHPTGWTQVAMERAT